MSVFFFIFFIFIFFVINVVIKLIKKEMYFNDIRDWDNIFLCEEKENGFIEKIRSQTFFWTKVTCSNTNSQFTTRRKSSFRVNLVSWTYTAGSCLWNAFPCISISRCRSIILDMSNWSQSGCVDQVMSQIEFGS